MEGKEGLGFHGEGEEETAPVTSLSTSVQFPLPSKAYFELPAIKCVEAPYGCPDLYFSQEDGQSGKN
jgi:hypothetical protein